MRRVHIRAALPLPPVVPAHTRRSQIPRIKYTADETKTWGMVYSRLMSMSTQYACKEYCEIMPNMTK